MLENLFGWRKASKCKKLIQMIRCRLRVLKSKRCCIANHLRDDVSQLLKNGHHRIAFQRVEQIIVDERTIESYDLLDHYCQFIIFHLPYIRKHRDCPVDINEAASTLIFSSPRFGELPELTPIKKLFGERYGHRFVITALELRPGNLVNPQIIKDNLCIKNVVSDDLKYKLLAELTISSIKQGPLYLEYKPENQALEDVNRLSCGEVQETPEEHIIESGRHLIMSLHEKKSSIIYFDHIEELVSPLSKDGDLRLFVFKSFGMIPLNHEAYYEIDTEDRNATEEKFILSMETSESETAIVCRSNSFRHSPCSHIHPKLPDYEELAAKFKAIKSANLGI